MPKAYRSGFCGVGFHHLCREKFGNTACSCSCGHTAYVLPANTKEPRRRLRDYQAGQKVEVFYWRGWRQGVIQSVGRKRLEVTFTHAGKNKSALFHLDEVRAA